MSTQTNVVSMEKPKQKRSHPATGANIMAALELIMERLVAIEYKLDLTPTSKPVEETPPVVVRYSQRLLAIMADGKIYSTVQLANQLNEELGLKLTYVNIGAVLGGMATGKKRLKKVDGLEHVCSNHWRYNGAKNA